MDFTDYLRQDLEDYEFLARAKRATAAPQSPGACERIPETAVAQEFSSLVVTASICASLANACISGNISEGSAASLLAIFASTTNGPALNLDQGRRQFGLDEFRQRLRFAQNITKGWIEGRNFEHLIVDIAITCEAWRNCCRSGTSVGRQLRTEAAQNNRADADWFDLHIAMLDDAARGQSPCIDASSKISVPGWADRRKVDRLRCLIDARLEIRGIEIQAIICDISAFGAGLKLKNYLPPTERVVVWIGDRSLLADIKWTADERLGVAWLEQLELADPLLDQHR